MAIENCFFFHLNNNYVVVSKVKIKVKVYHYFLSDGSLLYVMFLLLDYISKTIRKSICRD